MKKDIYIIIKNKIKPLIKSSITLLEQDDDDLTTGKLVNLARKVQNEDAFAAIELAIIAAVADELST